jgi:nucleoid DNA-binding protein
MSKNGQIAKEVSSETLDTAIIDVLLKGENIEIPGFGYLELKDLPDRRTVLFKAFTSSNPFVQQHFSEESEENDNSVLYSNISHPLKEGNSVFLPKLGTFRPVEKEDGSIRISFTPSSSLRERLNNDTKTTDDVSEFPIQENIPNEVIEKPSDKVVGKKSYTEEEPPVQSKVITPVTPPTPKKDIDALFQEDAEEKVSNKRKSIVVWVLVSAIVIAALVVLFIMYADNKKEQQPTLIYQSETLNLPDLANKYYGNSVFWVYIYDANKDKLTSPVNVPKGVELIIPDLTDYSVDINDSLEIKRAVIRADVILNSK